MKKLAFIFSFAICGVFVNAQTIDWAVQGDGVGDNSSFDIQLDTNNNAIYATGYFLNNDIDFGGTNLTNNGDYDFFLTKYDTAGNFIWARSVGDANDQRGRGVGVDPSGNVYAAGFFSGTMSFPTTPTATNLTSNGSRDIFVTKYSSSGNVLWATSIGATGGGGGSANDRAIDIAVDASGNSFVTGFFHDTIFFAGDTFPAPPGDRNAFIMKVNTSGTITNFYHVEGSAEVNGRYLDVDGADNVYAGGYYTGNVDLDADGTPDFTSSDGMDDGYLIKLDNNLNPIWYNAFGGANNDEVRGLAVDFSGNVYVSGSYRDNLSFGGCGTCFFASSTNDDAFYVKYDPTGTAVYANNIQGPGAEELNGIAVDAVTGDVYVTGRVSNNTLFTGGTVQTFSTQDIFIVKYSSTEALEWVFTVGGPTDLDIGYGIGVYNNSIYFGGQFRDTADFQGIALETYNGANEVFISKMVSAPVPNDECVNAQSLDIFLTHTPTSADLIGATSSVTACAGSSNDDEWFSFVATSDSVEIRVEATGAVPFDPVVQVYNGCGGASLACNNADADTMEVFSVTGLTPGNTYYLRVHSFNNNIFYNSANSIDTEYEISITSDMTTGIAEKGILSGATVAPNPAGSETSLIVHSSKSVSGVLKLMNSNGQLVSTQSVEVLSGTNQYDFDLNGLASGVYIINLVTEYEVINLPFVK